MDKTSIITKAIEAAKHVLGREIVIQSDADFTPPGKRVWRTVRHQKNGRRTAMHIRWYVGRKSYRALELTEANIKLSERWQAAASPM